MKNWIHILFLGFGLCLAQTAHAQVSAMGGGEYGYKAKINEVITQSNANKTAVEAIPAVIDEDNFASDSATRPASQQSVKAYVDAADALKAPLASPALTGTPTVPTATTGTNTTQAASTAFVQQEIGNIDSINLEYSASTASGGPLESDNSYSGPIFSGLNGGATIAQWDVVYFDGTAGEFLLADADGSGTRLAFGLAVAATTDGNPISIIREGFIRNDAYAWTPGARLYLSTTAGAITATAPSASGDTVKEVGLAITADIIFVDFSKLELTVE